MKFDIPNKYNVEVHIPDAYKVRDRRKGKLLIDTLVIIRPKNSNITGCTIDHAPQPINFMLDGKKEVVMIIV